MRLKTLKNHFLSQGTTWGRTYQNINHHFFFLSFSSSPPFGHPPPWLPLPPDAERGPCGSMYKYRLPLLRHKSPTKEAASIASPVSAFPQITLVPKRYRGNGVLRCMTTGCFPGCCVTLRWCKTLPWGSNIVAMFAFFQQHVNLQLSQDRRFYF